MNRPVRGKNYVIRVEECDSFGESRFRTGSEDKGGKDEQDRHGGSRSTSHSRSALRPQFVTLKAAGRGEHRKYLPLVFTEHGAIMAATIYVVRAFVRLRNELLANTTLEKRLAPLQWNHDQRKPPCSLPRSRERGPVEADEANLREQQLPTAIPR